MALSAPDIDAVGRGLTRLIFVQLGATATATLDEMKTAVSEADAYVDANLAAMGSQISANLTADQKRGVYAAVLLAQVGLSFAKRLLTR